jgi:hypothetical protein
MILRVLGFCKFAANSVWDGAIELSKIKPEIGVAPNDAVFSRNDTNPRPGS